MKRKAKSIKFTRATDKMTGGSAILQKKLHELETELADVISHPLDPTSSAPPRLQIPLQDIKQRFVFLNNLLQREISGDPQNPEELHEIGRRLTALQTAFRHSNEWRHSLCSDCSRALNRSDSGFEEGAFPGETQPENLLIGSKRDACTQVVPYDRGSGSDLNSDFSGEDENVRKEAAVTEEGVCGQMGKYSGAFGCGMIVGAICMAKFFYISFSLDSFPYETLLLPPT